MLTFGGIYCSHHQGGKNREPGNLELPFLRNVLQLLATANVIRILQTSSTPMMEVKRYSETTVLTRPTQRHISGEGILQDRERLYSGLRTSKELVPSS
jgi:hypothetical protein